MIVQVGGTLVGVADGTTVIVIKAPPYEVTLTCGGAEMIDGKSDAAAQASRSEPGPAGLQLGKRYVNTDATLEVLCTKPGSLRVEVNGADLVAKEAKPLPASD